MVKTLGIVFVLLLLSVAAWFIVFPGDSFNIVINGEPVTGPMRGAVGLSGIVVGAIALFCAAIVMVFVVAGVGVIAVGLLVLAGVVVALVMFPFMLPLLIPLFIVWLFVAIIRKSRSSA
jgi:hypothetical protein